MMRLCRFGLETRVWQSAVLAETLPPDGQNARCFEVVDDSNQRDAEVVFWAKCFLEAWGTKANKPHVFQKRVVFWPWYTRPQPKHLAKQNTSASLCSEWPHKHRINIDLEMAPETKLSGPLEGGKLYFANLEISPGHPKDAKPGPPAGPPTRD